MEEKNISSQESMAIISEMIERSKNRHYLGDGNILLLWGYTVVAVAALVWILLAITHYPAMNWFWFLIWIVGGIATPIMVRKRRDKRGVTTYADNLCNALWSIVGYSAIALTFLCVGFLLVGGKDSWSAMLLLPLVIVSIAEIMQGVVMCERSLIAGGAIGLLCGLFTSCCIAGGVTLSAHWYMPMFIIAFAAMMIIPGHVLNCKIHRKK
ncbi:MAG: hypothetical protein LIO90_01305 [Bacteroidales bacterium]|nr:hypothetical protein [Bacteroidales bacterium]